MPKFWSKWESGWNSLPQSVCMAVMLVEKVFLTYLTNAIKMVETLDFALRGKN